MDREQRCFICSGSDMSEDLPNIRFGYRNRQRVYIIIAWDKVLKELISPWSGYGHLVCADLYIASVQPAEVLHQEGLKFIGVVKTTTKKYPMKYFQAIELQKRGDRIGLVRRKKVEEG